MQIIKVKPYVYDVFVGNGFQNWTRVRKFPWGLKPMEGTHQLDRAEKMQVFNALESRGQRYKVAA